MKHIRTIIIFSLVAILTACTTKEKKAEKLLSDYFYTTLYDFDSYQPIETTVEETTMTPYLDEDCRTTAGIGVAARKMHKDAMDGFNDAVASMKIWGGSWDSYSRNKYNEARNEAVSRYESAKESLILSFDAMLNLKDMADSLSNAGATPKWTITHKYRCKSKGGYALLCKDIFLTDPKFKEILMQIQLEDENEQELQDFITEAVIMHRDSILKSKATIENLKGL